MAAADELEDIQVVKIDYEPIKMLVEIAGFYRDIIVANKMDQNNKDRVVAFLHELEGEIHWLIQRCYTGTIAKLSKHEREQYSCSNCPVLRKLGRERSIDL